MRINKVNPRTTFATALRLSRAMKLAKLKKNLAGGLKHKAITKADHRHNNRISEAN